MSPSIPARCCFAACVVVGAALLACSAGALALESGVTVGATDSAAVDAQPEGVAGLDLPERLELESLSAHGTASVGPDAGRAIQQNGSALDAAYRQYLLEERLERASSDEERARVLDASIEASNETARQLRERERAAVADYQSGDLSAAQLAGELGLIDARASQELDVVSATDDRAQELGIPGVGPRAEAFTAQLQIRQGELRAKAGESIVADAEPHRFYVASGDSGIVLSTIDGATFHREANRHDNHVATVEQGVRKERGQDLPEELYPRFSEFAGFTRKSWEDTERHVYRASGEYDYGSIDSYVDAHTEAVARENQILRLNDRLPTQPARNVTADNVTLSVERTYPTGPARVTVLNDGEPIEGATVSVANESVATTDADGRAWVVEPYDTPEIATTVDGTRVATSDD